MRFGNGTLFIGQSYIGFSRKWEWGRYADEAWWEVCAGWIYFGRFG